MPKYIEVLWINSQIWLNQVISQIKGKRKLLKIATGVKDHKEHREKFLSKHLTGFNSSKEPSSVIRLLCPINILVLAKLGYPQPSFPEPQNRQGSHSYVALIIPQSWLLDHKNVLVKRCLDTLHCTSFISLRYLQQHWELNYVFVKSETDILSDILASWLPSLCALEHIPLLYCICLEARS